MDSINPKCLVIGDTHFDNPFVGYLDAQLRTLMNIVLKSQPKVIVFLGDIFHKRSPDPYTLTTVWNTFKYISTCFPGLTAIYIIRGNHDSANKSDDGLSVLEVFNSYTHKTLYIPHLDYFDNYGFYTIPHYENESTILEDLKRIPNDYVVFGHFGYEGCMNATGYFDFSLSKEKLVNETVLGHIHRYNEDGNVTILGTPWSTNFGESDYTHYVMEYDIVDKKLCNRTLVAIDHGIRHLTIPYASLETMKEQIVDKNYDTVLRVILDKFLEDATNDLREKIIEEYKVLHVDLKFNPMLDKKLNNRLSNYDPQTPVLSLNDDIISQYIEEQASSIPRESLEEGLQLIREHADSESNS